MHAAVAARSGVSVTKENVTLHMHHCIRAVLETCLLKKGFSDAGSAARRAGLHEVLKCCYRWEFPGRGTLHIHGSNSMLGIAALGELNL